MLKIWLIRTMRAGAGGAIALALNAVQLPEKDAALKALQVQDAAVTSAGYRLALGNRDLCSASGFVSGVMPHTLNQYDAAFRKAAERYFAIGASPSVLAVAAGSPAERAGLRANDRLLAVDGLPFIQDQASGDAGSFRDTERALDLIDRASTDGRIALRVERSGVPSDIPVILQRGCSSRFQVVPGEGLKAQADGSYVQITAGLAAFARSDGELASVLAHELAHNILRHRIRLEGQGALRKGLFGPGARNARVIRATEIEADRLSPYLMANAGYDPRDAVRYWQRHGAERGDRWFRAGTHPRWRERVKLIEAEVLKIEHARTIGDAVRLPDDLAALIDGPDAARR